MSGRQIYHITHIDNFANILQSGAIYSYTRLQQVKADYVNIAHADIQQKRAEYIVPFLFEGKELSLHEFVPFHFAPRSPMLYTVAQGNVEGYDSGQEPLIYIVLDISHIITSGYRFLYTDGHPIMDFTKYYADISHLEEAIDWEIMNAKYWANTDEDPDRKRRRQAEFLILGEVAVTEFSFVAVKNIEMQSVVAQLLRAARYNIPVYCKPDWYY